MNLQPHSSAVEGAALSRAQLRTRAIETVPRSLRRTNRALGQTDYEVAPIGLGGAEFGQILNPLDSFAVLDRYRNLGGNFIFTADTYSAGASESIIGSWMSSRGNREDLIVATRAGSHPDYPGLDSVNLVRSVEASLRRLGTEYIDLLYLDVSSDSKTSMEDILASSQWLIESGKARAVALRGVSPDRLIEARILSAAGYPRVSVIEVSYNLINRLELAQDLRLVISAQEISVTASHTLEHGLLRTVDGYPLRVRAAAASKRLSRRNARVIRALELVAARHEASLQAVSLAWMLADKLVTVSLINVHSLKHLNEVMQAAQIRLSRSQLAELARATI